MAGTYAGVGGDGNPLSEDKDSKASTGAYLTTIDPEKMKPLEEQAVDVPLGPGDIVLFSNILVRAVYSFFSIIFFIIFIILVLFLLLLLLIRSLSFFLSLSLAHTHARTHALLSPFSRFTLSCGRFPVEMSSSLSSLFYCSLFGGKQHCLMRAFTLYSYDAVTMLQVHRGGTNTTETIRWSLDWRLGWREIVIHMIFSSCRSIVLRCQTLFPPIHMPYGSLSFSYLSNLSYKK